MDKLKNNMKGNSMDFLFYLCYGKSIRSDGDNIGKKNVESMEAIINIAVKEAYRNATLRAAYMIPKDKAENSARAYERAEETLKERVCDLLTDADNMTREKYNDFHHDVCSELCKIYVAEGVGFVNEGREMDEDEHKEMLKLFTPGNAQKWVNMTMKHVYAIYGATAVCGESGICGRVEDVDGIDGMLNLTPYLHAPIDSYILEGLKDDLTRIGHLGRQNMFLTGPRNNVRIRYEIDWETHHYRLSTSANAHVTTWSKIENYEIYEALRPHIRSVVPDGMNEIDWEMREWIKIGRRRGGGDDVGD